MSLIENYRRLSQLPRRNDRARVHIIGPDVMGEEWEEFLDDEETIQRIMNYLEATGDTDIRRGDVFIVEDYLNDDERVDSGKFSALSERTFISWINDPERNPLSRFLPTEFQVIEDFPLHYFDDVFDDPRAMHVPFHYWDHFGGVIEDLVIEPLIDDPDLEGTSFVARDGKTYFIIGDRNGINGSLHDSINILDYYQVMNPEYESDFSQYDLDVILYVPDISTPYHND